MATEEKLSAAALPRPESLFNLVRENHNLRETCVLLRGEIVALKEKLAAERRKVEGDSNRRDAEARTISRLQRQCR